MSMSDESLMAYADGEADAQTCLLVEEAMRNDPRIERRVAQHRALRAHIHHAYAAELNEPVSQRLLLAAQGVGSVAGKRKVRAWRVPAAMAASLLVGIAIGVSGGQHLAGMPFESTTVGLVASGELASTLSKQLASEQTAGENIRVGVSFLAKNGAYCRTFTLMAAAEAGLGCLQGSSWQIHVLTRSAAEAHRNDSLSPAASPLAPAIVNAVTEEISGDPLDATAERAARDAHWQFHASRQGQD